MVLMVILFLFTVLFHIHLSSLKLGRFNCQAKQTIFSNKYQTVFFPKPIQMLHLYVVGYDFAPSRPYNSKIK